MDSLLEQVGVVEIYLLIIDRQIVALAILFVDSTEHPSVSVVIGDLHLVHLRIQIADVIQEFLIPPQTARRGLFRIELAGLVYLFLSRIMLFLRIEEFAVGLFIPPHITQIGIKESVSIVYVTCDALAG